MAALQLRYGDLVQLIERMHALPGSRGGATESRIKNLSRLDFPPGPKVGSGERADYGVAATIKLLVAFELLRHRMPPAVIVELVRTEWERIAATFAEAARELQEGGTANDGRRSRVLLVDALALHEVGKTVRPDELLSTIEILERGEAPGGTRHGTLRSALILDPAAILAHAAEQLPWLRRIRSAEEFLAAAAEL